MLNISKIHTQRRIFLMSKMVNCKYCNNEIASKAKVCPHCGAKNKKPFYKAVWFYILIAVVVIGVSSSAMNSSSSSDSTPNSGTSEETATIEYTKVDIDELEDALENNAAAAKDTYNGQYLEITGRLGAIDSDLKYISLLSTTDDWDIVGIHCTIKNQETKDIVKTLSKDQTIVVRGKITDVGEILGYYLDIKEIIS
jgi:RNA polymerase subunit RPABC4/transcription elongation factor Spt4